MRVKEEVRDLRTSSALEKQWGTEKSKINFIIYFLDQYDYGNLSNLVMLATAMTGMVTVDLSFA